MKYFLDTEFIEDGKTIDLISIGIVAEDGREYYAQNLECNFSKASDWVVKNVIPHLDRWVAYNEYRLMTNPFWTVASLASHTPWRTKETISREIIEFVGEYPEFWAYYADYDWVVVCQLFGTMMDLPKKWPMYCMDIKQLAKHKGNPDLNTLPNQLEHNALEDANWNLRAYNYLKGLPYVN